MRAEESSDRFILEVCVGRRCRALRAAQDAPTINRLPPSLHSEHKQLLIVSSSITNQIKSITTQHNTIIFITPLIITAYAMAIPAPDFAGYNTAVNGMATKRNNISASVQT
jgi:hypothetical protein